MENCKMAQQPDLRLTPGRRRLPNTNSNRYHFFNSISREWASIVKRHIDGKSRNERETPEFVLEIHKKLLSIHKYNVQVGKVKHKYPHSKEFDTAVVKYLELEFDVCNRGNSNNGREEEVETRILTLLRAIGHGSITYAPDSSAAILKLLANVRFECRIENRLINNIVIKLVEEFRLHSQLYEFIGRNVHIGNDLTNFGILQAFKSFTTSDYGTEDSDSDGSFNSNLPLHVDFPNNANVARNKDDNRLLIDTISDNPDKRTKKHSVTLDCDNLDNNSTLSNTQCPLTKVDTILICSDSDDDDDDIKQINEVPLKNATIGVPTVVLDSDGEDFMIYLTKEVETRNKLKKKSRQRFESNRKIETVAELIISDSDDEIDNVVANSNCCPEKEHVKIEEDCSLFDEELQFENDNNIVKEEQNTVKHEGDGLILDDNTTESLLAFINTKEIIDEAHDNNKLFETKIVVEDTVKVEQDFNKYPSTNDDYVNQDELIPHSNKNNNNNISNTIESENNAILETIDSTLINPVNISYSGCYSLEDSLYSFFNDTGLDLNYTTLVSELGCGQSFDFIEMTNGTEVFGCDNLGGPLLSETTNRYDAQNDLNLNNHHDTYSGSNDLALYEIDNFDLEHLLLDDKQNLSFDQEPVRSVSWANDYAVNKLIKLGAGEVVTNASEKRKTVNFDAATQKKIKPY